MVKIYRNAVLLIAITYTLFFFLPYLWPHIYSGDSMAFLSLGGLGSTVDLSGSFPFIVSVLYIFSYVGLYYFHPLSRLLFTGMVIFNLTCAPFVFGYSATAYLDTSIGYLLTLLEGAILVMIYLTEISGRFKSMPIKLINKD